MSAGNIELSIPYIPLFTLGRNDSENDLAYSVSGFIAGERLKQGISQKELAEKSNTPQSTIARILGGKVSPQIDTLLPILEALGYTLTIVPNSKKDERDSTRQNVYSEYSKTLAALEGITELDKEVKVKIFFNVIKKLYELHPQKINHWVQRDGSELYAIYQNIILSDYNRPLNVLLEVVKRSDFEQEGDKYFIYIKNDILGNIPFGSIKFEHYFSKAKFNLDDEESTLPCSSYHFLDYVDGDDDFISYLYELLHYIDDDYKELVNQVIEKGYVSLRADQRIEFIDNVIKEYYVGDCERCGTEIPWSEKIMAATESDSLCGYCWHMWQKDD